MNDTDEQDVRHRLTPEGGQKWLDRIEHDALVSGWPSRSAWCKDVDIALSTIGGQPDSSRLPMIDILLRSPKRWATPSLNRWPTFVGAVLSRLLRLILST